MFVGVSSWRKPATVQPLRATACWHQLRLVAGARCWLTWAETPPPVSLGLVVTRPSYPVVHNLHVN